MYLPSRILETEKKIEPLSQSVSVSPEVLNRRAEAITVTGAY